MNSTKIIDFLSNKNVWKYYNEYTSTQWYSNIEMKEYQLFKFKKLIQHCYDNVPYYRNFMQSNGLSPSDFTKIDQISVFPIVTKEIIKDRYVEFIPDNLRNIKGVKVKTTGGTTGNILYKRNDANTRASIWGTFKRFSDWMDISDKDKTLILMGGHVIGKQRIDLLKRKLLHYITNSVSFNPYDTSDKNYFDIVNSLNSTHFSLIRSYSQFLFSFCQRLESEGLKFDVRAITTTAEPITDTHRNLFKRVLNASTFDQYGCGEIGGIAYECDKHEGLHVSEERVYLEINDKNQLVITDLDNFSMPFIRYFNADEAIVSDKLCSCGRKSMLLKKIMGRTCDYVIGLNGEILHWAYFWHLVFDSNIAKNNNLRKFQIVQNHKERLTIRLVASPPLTEREERVWISNIHSRMGEIEVNFVYEHDIENSASGKYRPVVCNIL